MTLEGGVRSEPALATLSAPVVLLVLAAAASLGACGTASGPAPGPRPTETLRKSGPPPVDDCAALPGKPPPEPLAHPYTGVAAKARCQREVYTIMGGLTHFLGVDCTFCHVEPNYEIMTHNKRVANWMARELIPRLEKKAGGEIWCNDCHVVAGKGTSKILGNPRSEAFAVDWMTTHLVGNFEVKGGKVLRCKGCHGGNLGSREFQKKIILTDRLLGIGRLPTVEPSTDAATPAPSSDAGAPLPASDAGTDAG